MKVTSLQEAQAYLESYIRPSVFERVQEDSHLKDPLDRMRVLLRLLGNPEKKFKSVQVSGTSGKGSTTYLLANILGKAGYKTGFASSPHLQNINERMQINMRKISNDTLVSLVNELIPAIDSLKKLPEGEPSYFELLTALAFMYFAHEKVDIAIIEVGLEGKYDATNVLDPLVVILTNISKDHTDMLGNTEHEIAKEAFSIIRKNEKGEVPVVITGVKQEELQRVLREKVDSFGAILKIVGKDFAYTIQERTKSGIMFTFSEGKKYFSSLEVRLRGEYQVENASLALAACNELKNFGFTITEAAIREGLTTAFFPGRFEVITNGDQTIILDGAHNEAKMSAFLHALQAYYPKEEKVFIVGFKKNKDTGSMIKELFAIDGADFIFTEFSKSGDYLRSNSMSLADLRSQIESVNPREEVKYLENVPNAFIEAQKRGKKLIIVTGSLYLVGEMREHLFPTE
jgi:dihydrofolate synthase/folylpolyglutamate synthase